MARSKERYNAYMKEYMKRRWSARRCEFIKLLGGVCSSCGTDDNLEFDHIDPDTKSFTIARASSFSKKRMEEEIKKCQLLCKPCHDDKTYRGR